MCVCVCVCVCVCLRVCVCVRVCAVCAVCAGEGGAARDWDTRKPKTHNDVANNDNNNNNTNTNKTATTTTTTATTTITTTTTATRPPTPRTTTSPAGAAAVLPSGIIVLATVVAHLQPVGETAVLCVKTTWKHVVRAVGLLSRLA